MGSWNPGGAPLRTTHLSFCPGGCAACVSWAVTWRLQVYLGEQAPAKVTGEGTEKQGGGRGRGGLRISGLKGHRGLLGPRGADPGQRCNRSWTGWPVGHGGEDGRLCQVGHMGVWPEESGRRGPSLGWADLSPQEWGSRCKQGRGEVSETEGTWWGGAGGG